MKSKVLRVVSRPGTEQEAVRADMTSLMNNPYNLVCSNITSMYGGYITKDSWKESSQRKLKVDPKKKRNADMTSCDEEDSTSLVQAYDDDKMELLCFEHWWNIIAG